MVPTDHENQEQSEPRRTPEGWAERLSSVALWALPVSTVLVIAIAIFVVGAPRSYRAARVWGGPTTSQPELSFRVQVFDRLGELERAVPGVQVDLVVSHHGKSIPWHGPTDSAGFAHPLVALVTDETGEVELELDQGSLSLAAGRVKVSLDEWRRGVTRRGGWTRARQSEPFAIRVRPERGVFAVPFADPLLVEVRDAHGPVAGAELEFRPEGARVIAQHRPMVSDSRGRVRVLLAPDEHHPTLGIEVSSEGRTSKWNSTLPVVPGAMHARLDAGRLVIRSPIVRDAAYFSLVTETSRLSGGRAVLEPDGRGGASVSLPVSIPRGRPSWAVVSSEADLQAPATVGWPLVFEPDEATTFDVPDRLWLDGAPQGYARNQRVYRQARWLAGSYALLALGLVLLLLFRKVRLADARLASHLKLEGDANQRPVAARRYGLPFVVAVLCVSLGFVLVLLVALYRIGVP